MNIRTLSNIPNNLISPDQSKILIDMIYEDTDSTIVDIIKIFKQKHTALSKFVHPLLEHYILSDASLFYNDEQKLYIKMRPGKPPNTLG